MSLRTLLFAQIFAFVGLLGIVLWATLQLASSDGGDALYINVAGRQRMLSQRATKEALEYAQSPSRAQRERLEATVHLFAQSHRALRLGGDAQAGLQEGMKVSLRGAADAKLVGLLDAVDAEWKVVVGSIDTLLETSPRRATAVARLAEKAPQVLTNMDQAVRYFTTVEKPNYAAIDVAGRQRMLSQRAALQALGYDARPSSQSLAALQATVALFSRSHVALRDGGRVPTRLDGTGVTRLPVNRDERIRAKLDEVEDFWVAEREAIEVLAEDPNQHREALQALRVANPAVLATMNDAVFRAQEVAEENLRQLETVQLVALGLGLGAALLGGLLAFNISSTLNRLRGMADEISRGRVGEPVPPIGIGEVRALSQSFERMRFSLNATMKMQEGSQDTQPGETGDSYASLF